MSDGVRRERDRRLADERDAGRLARSALPGLQREARVTQPWEEATLAEGKEWVSSLDALALEDRAPLTEKQARTPTCCFLLWAVKSQL